MLATLLRTRIGSQLVEFMRSDRGKKIDRFLVEQTGFSLLMKLFAARGGFPPIPVLMLYTRGRRSGEQRATVMPYLELDGRIYLIGSNGAKKRDPFWVDNLRAQPEARIMIGRKRLPVHARLVEPGSVERDRVWHYASTKTAQYQTYQTKTDRPIPIVALS